MTKHTSSKEKIKDILDYIDHLIMAREVDRNDSLNVGSNADANLYTNMIKELEKIKKIIGLVSITLFIASMIWMVN